MRISTLLPSAFSPVISAASEAVTPSFPSSTSADLAAATAPVASARVTTLSPSGSDGLGLGVRVRVSDASPRAFTGSNAGYGRGGARAGDSPDDAAGGGTSRLSPRLRSTSIFASSTRGRERDSRRSTPGVAPAADGARIASAESGRFIDRFIRAPLALASTSSVASRDGRRGLDVVVSTRNTDTAAPAPAASTEPKKKEPDERPVVAVVVSASPPSHPAPCHARHAPRSLTPGSSPRTDPPDGGPFPPPSPESESPTMRSTFAYASKEEAAMAINRGAPTVLPTSTSRRPGMSTSGRPRPRGRSTTRTTKPFSETSPRRPGLNSTANAAAAAAGGLDELDDEGNGGISRPDPCRCSCGNTSDFGKAPGRPPASSSSSSFELEATGARMCGILSSPSPRRRRSPDMSVADMSAGPKDVRADSAKAAFTTDDAPNAGIVVLASVVKYNTSSPVDAIALGSPRPPSGTAIRLRASRNLGPIAGPVVSRTVSSCHAYTSTRRTSPPPSSSRRREPSPLTTDADATAYIGPTYSSDDGRIVSHARCLSRCPTPRSRRRPAPAAAAPSTAPSSSGSAPRS
mmetsp:Transcript_11131/g.46448  ORF Transcript_11131/g.46448 Transcript_11131/m.46448 type:complete len:575 (+) Transcript_11131:198-1922(+)